MAERRMFAKTIVLSDAFLDMPLSARCLYFTLGMLADDDGFVNNPKSIMRQCGASQDDLKILLAKKFLLSFESGVIVIKHWKINNYLRNDRYQQTKYAEEKSMIFLDENKSYTFNDTGCKVDEPKEKKLTDTQIKRLEEKKESDLPYSFEYKIRNAFLGERCPICNKVMSNEWRTLQPTIQHNKPISLGGKHEIDNISVICLSCNARLQNEETGELNNSLVKQKWEIIKNSSEINFGIPNIESGIPSIGKDSIDKDSIEHVVVIDEQEEKNEVAEEKQQQTTTKSKRFVKPTIEEIKAYCEERKNGIDAEYFFNYYESKGWQVGKSPMKNWKASVITWEKKDFKGGAKNEPSSTRNAEKFNRKNGWFE